MVASTSSPVPPLDETDTLPDGKICVCITPEEMIHGAMTPHHLINDYIENFSALQVSREGRGSQKENSGADSDTRGEPSFWSTGDVIKKRHSDSRGMCPALWHLAPSHGITPESDGGVEEY